MQVKVAIVGFGYWGPNVARNFALTNKAKVTMICDTRAERTAHASKLYPSVTVTSDYDDVLESDQVDLVVLATPVSTHHPLGMKALEAGKHLLIEKPMAASSAESAQLLKAAQRHRRMLFVDHTFVFTPAVQKMKALLAAGDLGKPLYYDSTRINLGLFQHDVDVVWDLMPHDLSILDYLLDGAVPETVSCRGVRHYSKLADQAYVTLTYPGNFIAHAHVNWVAPVKVRQVLLCGDKKMLVYDENTVHEKVRVYDRGVSVNSAEDVYKRLVQYREGDMFAPRLDNFEALALEVDNILDSINGTAKPVIDGSVGHRVVLLLEAATDSLNNWGRPVNIAQ